MKGKEMKQMFSLGLAALVLAGCATVSETTPEKELTEPEMVQLTDPNPFANYGPAMASAKGLPMAYEWQKAADAEIAAATEPEVLAKLLAEPGAAARLLAQVKGPYESDPLVLTQIAALSQFVMRPACSAADRDRAVWNLALLHAAMSAPDAYRKMFYLDQLRWCGLPAAADIVRAIGTASADQAVGDFAEQVAVELARE